MINWVLLVSSPFRWKSKIARSKMISKKCFFFFLRTNPSQMISKDVKEEIKATQKRVERSTSSIANWRYFCDGMVLTQFVTFVSQASEFQLHYLFLTPVTVTPAYESYESRLCFISLAPGKYTNFTNANTNKQLHIHTHTQRNAYVIVASFNISVELVWNFSNEHCCRWPQCFSDQLKYLLVINLLARQELGLRPEFKTNAKPKSKIRTKDPIFDSRVRVIMFMPCRSKALVLYKAISLFTLHGLVKVE